jgi:hypothetical protein
VDHSSITPPERGSTSGGISLKNTPLVFLFVFALLAAGCERPSAGPSERTGDGATASGDPIASATWDGPDADRGTSADDESGSAKRSSATVATPEQLVAALKEKNPGFRGELQMEPISPELLALVIKDPGLKDISPLARQRIGRLDLSHCDIADLSPLQGLPLDWLFLEDNPRLADISALRGMPLQKLYLSRTRVENLGPLRGAPLEELNLLGARVKDLSPLAECPLKMLWLTGCPVADIGPLRRVPLVSLTLQDTRVADLSPLANHPLQRLHIGGTEVTDLTPLDSLRLTRLIFTPGKIKTGLDVVRKMPSLEELGTRFDDAADDKMPPAAFWEMYDKGELK